RTQVYNFLAGPEEAEVGRAQMSLVQDGELRPVMPLGRNSHAILINRPFDKVGDSCVESSYNDYAKNQCWICQDDTRTEFDLWLGCHHIFCSKCSTEMLKRHMPCPLCRVASTSVLRGQSCTQGFAGNPTLLSPSRARTIPNPKGAKLLAPPQQGPLL
ncbi:unnamed protein product, partial [Effrenium voratum]